MPAGKVLRGKAFCENLKRRGILIKDPKVAGLYIRRSNRTRVVILHEGRQWVLSGFYDDTAEAENRGKVLYEIVSGIFSVKKVTVSADEVEFLTGEKLGVAENIPGGKIHRLKDPGRQKHK